MLPLVATLACAGSEYEGLSDTGAEGMEEGEAGDGEAGSDSDGSGTSGSGDSATSTETGDDSGTGMDTGGDTTTTSDTGDSGGFIQTDGGIEGGCTPGVLDDCPEGEKCSAYLQEPGACCVDTNACVPIIGNKQLGDECTRDTMNDDCDNGLFCMSSPSSGSTGPGFCLAFCDISNPSACADAGLPEANCISFNDGVLPLCEDDCNPLDQDCDNNFGCYGVGEQFACALPGFADGEGKDDSECNTVQSCEPGLECADGTVQEGCDFTACCTPFCDTNNGGAECSAGTEDCVPYFDGNAPPGLGNVGLCTIPQ